MICSVKYGGKVIDVLQGNIYPCPYNEYKQMPYAIMTFEDNTTFSLTTNQIVDNVVIRPLSLGIKAEIQGSTISFVVNKPIKVSVEINGCENSAFLAIFNPPIEKVPYGENLIYFEKGIHHPGIIKIDTDDTVVYFEEGAYVHGKIHAENCKNLVICGNGVLTMEEIPRETTAEYLRCIDIHYCSNVKIHNLIIHDSVDWSLRLNGCDDCHITDVTIIGSRGNSDGIDICGSRNVLTENCFTRVWDDSLVVKALDTGNVENITFKKCVLWNDFARPVEVGVELRADIVRNILFEDIDVIHSPTGYPIIGIHHGDRGKVSDITFKDIRIEDTPGAQIFDIRITKAVWNRDKAMGNIRNITFSDISLVGKPGITGLPERSRIHGYSKENNIDGVTFHNMTCLGKTATDIETCNVELNEFVDNIKVTYDTSCDPIYFLDTALEISKPFELGSDGFYRGSVQIRLENNSDKNQPVDTWLKISPVNTAEYNMAHINKSIDPKESCVHTYDVVLPPGKYVMRVDSSLYNVGSPWIFLPLDLKIKEKQEISLAPVYEFVNYYNIRTKGIQIGCKNDSLILKSELLKDKNAKFVVYAAKAVKEEEGEVKFTVEETDFGEAAAIVKDGDGLALAPQLRCPAEITYVFKNEPKTTITRKELACQENGIAFIPFHDLGIPNSTKNFWLEIELQIDEVAGLRYPYTLFHSVRPDTMAHMFANVLIEE